MDASDLRVFEAVARLGGMNRAAAELNTVQSNVTARVQALEAEIGSPLFGPAQPWRGADPGRPPAAALCRQGRPAARRRDARRPGRGRAARHAHHRVAGDNGGAAPDTATGRLAAGCPDVDLVLRTGTTCELLDGRPGAAGGRRVRLRPGPASRRRRAGDVSRGTGAAGGPALSNRSRPCSMLARCGLSYCGPAARTGRCWRRCWRAAARWCSANWSSAHWRRSSAASPRGSGSHCCRAR